jgi:integrase/recombinase XerD
MTEGHSPVTGTPLRQRMIADMHLRGFAEKTRKEYIRCVCRFAAFLGRSPDTAAADDVRRFQVHQATTGMTPQTINTSVSALRFFFTTTLDRPDLSRKLVIVRQTRKLPTVLSQQEVIRLLTAQHRNQSTRLRLRLPMGLVCGCLKSWRSRSMMLTASGC